MQGALWAMAAGIAFGLFQATNRRGGMGVDPYVATFVVLAVSVVALGATAVATQDLELLAETSAAAVGWFALAGGVHFFLGWTFLGLSQRSIGASRTGVLVGTTPLFGTAVAFTVLDETVRPSALVGVLLVVLGVVVLNLPRLLRRSAPAAADGGRSGWVFAALTALCWAWSPVFIRWGLADLPSPLIGVTVGMGTTVTAYGIALALRGTPATGRLDRASLRWLVAAGLLVGLGTGGQWIALDLAPVGIVLALNQLAVPVVVLAAPIIVGREAEPYSLATALGGLVVLFGTLVIILARS